jgi:hypothetical protein
MRGQALRCASTPTQWMEFPNDEQISLPGGCDSLRDWVFNILRDIQTDHERGYQSMHQCRVNLPAWAASAWMCKAVQP